jgi:hypothetical protein
MVKRWSRAFLSATTVLSALMFIAASGSWVRARYACDTVSYLWVSRMDAEIEDRRVGAMGVRGSLVLIWMHRIYRPDDAADAAVVRRELPSEMGFDHERLLPQHWPARGVLGAAGFGWISQDPAQRRGRDRVRVGNTAVIFEPYTRMILVPWWFLLLLFSIAPCRALWRRRTRRTKYGCATCGYDLRATPERCPECGTATAVPRKA